ncbi:hypothetical protein FSP39_015138 [Pinctada imbricata]|uniref:Uncharacterized protein n=1 Tax=Pinctada imbricata TaxID=66713 RepID=A0AA89BXH2_PINIB|nr:hypothetical protein FSP39_015138 [Pinctada imbricata]
MACGDFSETFPNSFEKNLEIVTNYRFVVPHGSLKKLNLDTIGIEVLNNKVSDSKVPVIVTAASANHFEEVQGLIEMLMTRYKGFKLIFYDIGLESNQVSVIKCEFRRFPFSKYPEYFRILRNYVWKPLIIQLVLIEYDFVLWMDASVRLNGLPLEELFEEARKTGIKILRGYGLIVKQTHLNTFKALEEKPCMFQGQELQATWIIVSRTNFTLRAILKPWVSCALQYGCMAQDNAERLYRGRSSKHPGNHLRHRFEQSVISIILTRLYHDHIKDVHIGISKFGAIMRGDKSHFFTMLDDKWFQTNRSKT